MEKNEWSLIKFQYVRQEELQFINRDGTVKFD